MLRANHCDLKVSHGYLPPIIIHHPQSAKKAHTPVTSLGSALLVSRMPEVHDGAEGAAKERGDHRTETVGDHALGHRIGIT